MSYVVRDSKSNCLAVRRKEIRAPNVLVAEALGALEGCALAQQMRYSRIFLESDSKEVISLFNGCMDNGGWEVFPNLCKIRQVGNSFLACNWSLVSRSANGVANFIVSHYGAEMSDLVWFERPLGHLQPKGLEG